MIVTLADMKTRLGIGDASQDAFLTEQLNVVQEAVESYCRRKFEQATYVQTFYRDEFEENGVSVPQITTYMFPVISIASIDEISRDDDGVPTVEASLTANEYRLEKSTGRIKKTQKNGISTNFFSGRPWFYGYTELEITYDAGYSIADMPQTIRDVIFNLVTERYNKNKNGQNLNFGSDVQRVSIPGVMSIDYDYTLETNNRSHSFGAILGNQINVLDYWRSERGMIGDLRTEYV